MKNKLIIISGPTGVGKSSMSIDLAKTLDTEIISADSMQIYRGMDIGTAKIKKSEMEGIVHHMIDIKDPKDNFSVHDFQERALKLVDKITSKGKIPIIVGGTGLYINSIFYKYDFSKVEPNEEFRMTMEEKYKANPKNLLDKLVKIAPDKYKGLTTKDKKKIIRALEVYEFSGKTITVDSKPNEDYDIYLYVLNNDRKILYEDINKRVDQMLEDGLVDEVKGLLDQGLNGDYQSMKAIGYREIIPYINGDLSYDDACDLLKKDSRRYAKRQLTWFRKNEDVIWLDKSTMTKEEMMKKILEDIGR